MNTEAIKKIADTYGFSEQSRQLYEEMAELIIATNKAYRLQKNNICPFFDEVAMERKNAFNNVIEEMADVLEVLFAICEGRGHTVEELMQVREAKREKRGGFKDKIYWVGNEE